MQTIELTQGKFALVDDEDYEWLNQWKWYAMKDNGGNWYARRQTGQAAPRGLYLHQALLGKRPGMMVDHANGDSLDNRRENLRWATNRQNQHNGKLPRHNTSGLKGVTKRGKRWSAQLKIDGRDTYLGTFGTPEEASAAYESAAKAHRGEFFREPALQALDKENG